MRKWLALMLVAGTVVTASPAGALSEADPNQDGKRHTRADRRAYELLTRNPGDWACQASCSQADRNRDRRDAITAGRLIAARRWNWTNANGQFTCVYRLWSQESGWGHWQPGGIPQFRPESKCRAGCNDPLIQIRQGYQYIHNNYGQPTGTGCNPPY